MYGHCHKENKECLGVRLCKRLFCCKFKNNLNTKTNVSYSAAFSSSVLAALSVSRVSFPPSCSLIAGHWSLWGHEVFDNWGMSTAQPFIVTAKLRVSASQLPQNHGFAKKKRKKKRGKKKMLPILLHHKNDSLSSCMRWTVVSKFNFQEYWPKYPPQH